MQIVVPEESFQQRNYAKHKNIFLWVINMGYTTPMGEAWTTEGLVNRAQHRAVDAQRIRAGQMVMDVSFGLWFESWLLHDVSDAFVEAVGCGGGTSGQKTGKEDRSAHGAHHKGGRGSARGRGTHGTGDKRGHAAQAKEDTAEAAPA
jgi:hypothetical protein